MFGNRHFLGRNKEFLLKNRSNFQIFMKNLTLAQTGRKSRFFFLRKKASGGKYLLIIGEAQARFDVWNARYQAEEGSIYTLIRFRHRTLLDNHKLQNLLFVAKFLTHAPFHLFVFFLVST